MSSENGRDGRPTSRLDNVEQLESVAFVPSKQRHTDASSLAKSIASDAYENGIPQLALQRLIKLFTRSNHLDQGTVTTLVKNLYPLDRVSSNLVTQLVCCLGPTKNKPSTATQALLLRWLILVYDVLEDKTHLSKLYAVLFNCLDMLSLRKPLCHLLSLMTRRKHVKPFRIQALMELLRNAGGEEKELISLLRVFKNYYPDIIIGDLGTSRRAGLVFKHPDPEWTSHLRNLQDANAERLAAQPSDFQVIHRGLSKRSKVEVIVPDVQTSRVSDGHTSLEELRGVDHFAEKLEKIELPNQIVSTLGDAMAQKFLYLVQPEAANYRLDDWLSGFLGDKLGHVQDGDTSDSEELSYVLRLAVFYVQFTKEIPAAITAFLKDYLLSWDGKDNREQILSLLEYLPVQEYEIIRAEFLEPLETAVLDETLCSKTGILDFYTSLIRQWGVELRSNPGDTDECKPLSRVIVHAELWALSILESAPGLQTDDSNTTTKPATQSVLEFYSSLAELFSHAASHGSIRLTIPLSPTVYTLAFTPINSVPSIFNSALARYKAAFETSLTSNVLQSPKPSETLYPAQLVSRFNGYIMDLCNLVWRNRALNTEDPNALGCLIPRDAVQSLTEYVRATSRERRRDSGLQANVGSIYSLSHHPALCNLSAACFADIDDEQGIGEGRPRLARPVTQKALSALEREGGVKMSWQEYRLRMLEWLDEMGSTGTGDLMRSTMKALRKE